MSWKQEFSRWLSYAQLDAELKEQLENMKQDEKKIEDSFYKNLEFGTGGMRGVGNKNLVAGFLTHN
ncbi:hypothetical protein CWB31_15520 [Bacillus cereus]|uniref:hypothetical protein n=1 Tax=Bacillus cereus TaxID=1396 RepID=UPI001BADAB03|nr:hypothetical protein [Bacillus cereus]MBR9667129.1 hypothetical protein [Bacillus cereus]